MLGVGLQGTATNSSSITTEMDDSPGAVYRVGSGGNAVHSQNSTAGVTTQGGNSPGIDFIGKNAAEFQFIAVTDSPVSTAGVNSPAVKVTAESTASFEATLVGDCDLRTFGPNSPALSLGEEVGRAGEIVVTAFGESNMLTEGTHSPGILIEPVSTASVLTGFTFGSGPQTKGSHSPGILFSGHGDTTSAEFTPATDEQGNPLPVRSELFVSFCAFSTEGDESPAVFWGGGNGDERKITIEINSSGALLTSGDRSPALVVPPLNAMERNGTIGSLRQEFKVVGAIDSVGSVPFITSGDDSTAFDFDPAGATAPGSTLELLLLNCQLLTSGARSHGLRLAGAVAQPDVESNLAMTYRSGPSGVSEISVIGEGSHGILIAAGEVSGSGATKFSIGAGARVFSQMETAVFEEPTAAMDATIRVAGEVASGSQQAIDLGAGDDSLVLLPTFAIIGGVSAGGGTDALVFDGEAGTSGLFDLAPTATYGLDNSFEQLRKTGAGTWTLASAVAVTSPIRNGGVDGGTLLVNAGLPALNMEVGIGGTLGGNGMIGRLNCAGTLAPGTSAGRFSVGVDLSLAATALLDLEIGGTAPTAHDQVQVGGLTTLGGVLRVGLTDRFESAIQNSDTFRVVSGPVALGGSFANVASGQRLVTADCSGSFLVEYGPGSPAPSHVVLSDYQPLVSETYAEWVARFQIPASDADPTDDPNADGLSNLEAYARGIPPLGGTDPDSGYQLIRTPHRPAPHPRSGHEASHPHRPNQPRPANLEPRPRPDHHRPDDHLGHRRPRGERGNLCAARLLASTVGRRSQFKAFFTVNPHPQKMNRSKIHNRMPLPRMLALFTFMILLFTVGRAHCQSVSTDQFSYGPDEAIVVAFSGGPGNPNDQIAIYGENVLPGEDDPLYWQNVNGSSEGTITFSGELNRPGIYFVFFVLQGSDEILASQYFEVGWSSDPDAFIYTQYSNYLPNTPISVTWTGGTGNALDRIAIYPDFIEPGNGEPTLWQYVGGGQSPGAGLSEGTVTFQNGLDSGYRFRVFLMVNDGQTVLAGRAFSLALPIETLLRTNKRVYAPGESITVEFLNGFGGPKDWIGIYPAGANPGNTPPLLRQYSDGTQSGDVGTTEGSVDFNAGIAAFGTYQVLFFYDDTFSRIAEETIFVRQSVESPSLPALNIAHQASEITVWWEPTKGIALEMADNLINPEWLPVDDGTSSVTGSWTVNVSPDEDAQFFRLRSAD